MVVRKRPKWTISKAEHKKNIHIYFRIERNRDNFYFRIAELRRGAYLFLEDSDALILEWLAEFDELGTFRIDRQRCDDHVCPFVDYLANKTRPFLFPSDF